MSMSLLLPSSHLTSLGSVLYGLIPKFAHVIKSCAGMDQMWHRHSHSPTDDYRNLRLLHYVYVRVIIGPSAAVGVQPPLHRLSIPDRRHYVYARLHNFAFANMALIATKLQFVPYFPATLKCNIELQFSAN